MKRKESNQPSSAKHPKNNEIDKDVLEYVDNADFVKVDVPQMKKLLVKLEKSIQRNNDMRLKFTNEPQKLVS